MSHPKGSLYRLTEQQARLIREAMIANVKADYRLPASIRILNSLDAPVQPVATPAPRQKLPE